jgi:WD40 repeat protein
MDFSDLFKYNGSCSFSPDSQFVANIVGNKICVRDLESLQIIHVFTALDNINSFVWSHDSSLIACAVSKKSIVQVWSIIDTTYKLQIYEFAGVQTCFFSPCANFVFIPCDLNLKVSVWAIDGSYVGHINNPKSATKCYDFSPKGDSVAIAERKNGRDFIHVICLDTLEDLHSFEVETEDLADLKFSPDGKYICAWDSMMDYKLALYRLDGTLVNSYSAYENLLGIKKVQWGPTSQLIAIGSYDSKIRILNRINWKIVDIFDHTQLNKSITIFKESMGKCKPISFLTSR